MRTYLKLCGLAAAAAEGGAAPAAVPSSGVCWMDLTSTLNNYCPDYQMYGGSVSEAPTACSEECKGALGALPITPGCGQTFLETFGWAGSAGEHM